MQDEGDTAIDKTLAALNNASPPEGMEARIEQRLRYQATQTGGRAQWSPAADWWRGMLTGVAIATVLCCAVLFGLRGRLFGNHASRQVAFQPASTVRPAIMPTSTPTNAAEPCTRPALRKATRRVAGPQIMRAAVETPKNRTAAEEDRLTPQERELVRLAHVADPQELSTMSFEARAQLDAQQSAAFEKFFTPPPPPPHDLGENE